VKLLNNMVASGLQFKEDIDFGLGIFLAQCQTKLKMPPLNPNVFLCIFKVDNNLPFLCALSLKEIILRKVLFSFKNEYVRLDHNNFKSSFGGWTLEGMDSIDHDGNFSIFSLRLLAFDSSPKINHLQIFRFIELGFTRVV